MSINHLPVTRFYVNRWKGRNTILFGKNLLRGLIWFGVILTAYIPGQRTIKVYQAEINSMATVYRCFYFPPYLKLFWYTTT